MRELQSPDAAELLARDGSNLASVLARMSANGSRANTRVEEYLAAVAPGVEGVDAKSIGPKETIEFRQQMAGSPDPWRFPAANMSDGTVRALGILVALFQPGSGCAGPSLVGIEEPEAALHPAAVGALLDSLREASRTTQVMVTSHSPDLLDDDEIETSALVAVTAEGGVATLAPIDDAGRSALRDRLYTAGELLRQNQLRPDPAAARLSPGQLSLFGEAPA